MGVQEGVPQDIDDFPFLVPFIFPIAIFRDLSRFLRGGGDDFFSHMLNENLVLVRHLRDLDAEHLDILKYFGVLLDFLRQGLNFGLLIFPK